MPDPTDTTTGPPAPTPPAAQSPSTPAASPAATPPSSSGPTTNVSVAYPVSEFDSGIEGVPVILSTPTAVPTSSLSALHEAADASHGVNLIEEQS